MLPPGVLHAVFEAAAAPLWPWQAMSAAEEAERDRSCGGGGVEGGGSGLLARAYTRPRLSSS
jgi:hypothetical protein